MNHMNGPGVSLFQGAEFKLNQTNPEDEEAENAEEERRRNAELRHLLSGAFDDLQINDADHSFASSKNLTNQSLPGGVSSSDEEPQMTPKRLTNGHHTNGHITNGHGDIADTPMSNHYKHCFHTKGAYADSSAASSPAKKKITNGGDADQLAALYDVRMREITRLQDVLETTKREAAERFERLGQKILNLEAEKAATNSSLNQTQSLLVAGKEQIGSLLKQVEDLKSQNLGLNELREELEQDGIIMRANIESLNSKLRAMEKISNETSGARQADMIVKSLQDRHTQDIVSYQVQIKELKDKLSESAEHAKAQERRIAELTREYDRSMLERVNSVSQLSKALVDSKQSYQKLLTLDGSDSLAEITRLRSKVEHLEGDVKNYQTDIEQLETMIGMSVLTSNSSEAQVDMARFYKTGLDSVQGLREELSKSLRIHESRRAEIKQLKYLLQERETTLHLAQQQEEKFREELLRLQMECDELKNGAKEKVFNRHESHSGSQETAYLKEKISTLEEAIVRLESQNTQLAEQNVEVQRCCDEEKLKTIDNYSKEYLKFHSDGLSRARQEEREHIHREMQKLKIELDLALKDADDAKQAYINLVSTKNTVANELDNQRKIMDKLQNQIGGSSKHDLGEAHIALYEERIKKEIENAKREMLEEVSKEKEELKRSAKLEAEKEFEKKIDEAIHAARVEWQKNNAPIGNQPPHQAEVQRLKNQLEEEREEAKKQRKNVEEKLWAKFHEELMRLDQQHADLKTHRYSDQTDMKVPQNEDASTSMRKTHSLNDLETRVELEDCINKLNHELKESKKTHTKRLMELQDLLFTKQKEMEEFKQKLVDYTKHQFEAKDKQNDQYVVALKKEIECLNEELSKKMSFESGHEEVKKLRNDRLKFEEERTKLKKLVEKQKEKMSQAKDYYEKREALIIQQFKKKEDGYYSILLKLKKEVDSTLFDCLSEDESFRPVKK